MVVFDLVILCSTWTCGLILDANVARGFGWTRARGKAFDTIDAKEEPTPIKNCGRSWPAKSIDRDGWK